MVSLENVSSDEGYEVGFGGTRAGGGGKLEYSSGKKSLTVLGEPARIAVDDDWLAAVSQCLMRFVRDNACKRRVAEGLEPRAKGWFVRAKSQEPKAGFDQC